LPVTLRDLVRRPIIVAPMAGGPSCPALATAAAQAGALAILAAGYKSVEAMVGEMAAVRAATTEPFGVNLFVPGRPTEQRRELVAYLGSLEGEARAAGVRLGDPVWDDDGFDAKVAALIAAPPPLTTFTFGCPPVDVAAALREAGSVVAVTVTGPEEARVAAECRADCLCLQGPEAGGHRATFANDGQEADGTALLDLIEGVRAVTDLPLIAAGGLMDASAVAAVLARGAVAAQCGTAFLRCPESGAPQAHKDALGDRRFAATALTRAFSGRPARGLVNRFLLDHTDAPAAYPEINNATRPLRVAAATAGDPDRMALYAGSGYRAARARPTAEVVELLCP
jgi:nitronate monooxygenase